MSAPIHKHDTRAIVCSHVVEDGLPVCTVIRESDGEWQFLCNGDDHTSVATARIACLGCMRMNHPDVAALIDDLALGEGAWRSMAEARWTRYEHTS